MSTTTPRRGADPRVKLGILGLGLVVLVALVGYQIYQARKAPTGEDPHNDISALSATTYGDYPGGVHTNDPVTYRETPPLGGPHNPAWEDCGVYTRQVANENAVHSLEHGTVWITYRPGLSAAGVQALESALGQVEDKKTILSPYPGLPAPVVVTVWNAQLRLKGPDDSRLPVFIDFYGDGHTSPEGAFASCAGGVKNYASGS